MDVGHVLGEFDQALEVVGVDDRGDPLAVARQVDRSVSVWARSMIAAGWVRASDTLRSTASACAGPNVERR